MVLGITVEDLIDIMNIREHVEGLAAFYAAKNIDEESITQLNEILQLQDFYYQQADQDKLQKMDDRFHDAIYEISNRTVLHDTLLPLHRKTMRYRRAAIKNAERLRQSVAEHKQIIEAIIAGDAEKAQSLMSNHIKNAKEHMIERFVKNG